MTESFITNRVFFLHLTYSKVVVDNTGVVYISLLANLCHIAIETEVT